MKETAKLDKKMKALLRGLIYPVQFDQDPADGVDRVLRQVIYAKAMNASPPEYLTAILAGLESDEPLADLIPQEHSERAIRTYLFEIQKRLQNS